MATIKLSALAAIAAASISATDILPMTDSDAGTPTTYKATVAQLRTAVLQASVGAGWGATDYLGLGAGTIPTTGMVRVGQGAIVADAPLINSTATWNNVAITFRHILVNITDTTSAVGSAFADFQIVGASKWKLDKTGAVTQAGGLTATTGVFTGDITLSNGKALLLTRNTGSAVVAGLRYDVGTDDLSTVLGGTIMRWRDTGAGVLMSLTASGALSVLAGVSVTGGGLVVSAGTTAVQALTVAGTLTMSTAASKLVPGASSFSHRNNADSADNLLISDAGDVSIRARAAIGAGGIAPGVMLNLTSTHPSPLSTSWGAVIAPQMTVSTSTAAIPLQLQLVIPGSAATLASGYGLLVKSPSSGTSTITTSYGIYVENQISGGGLTAWSIFCESGGVTFRNTALATSATAGHLFIPSCAGVPTGVPATIPSGQVALQYDSTNNQLYVYNGAWKKTVALT